MVDIYSKDGKQPSVDSESNLENSELENKEDQSSKSSRQSISDREFDPNNKFVDEPKSEHSESGDTEDSKPYDELESLRQKIAELEENILREKAENQNTRKRLQKDIESARDSGVEKLVREFLPVKDSLDMGLANLDGATDLESLKTGIELTLKMVDDFLDKLEISKIDHCDM